MKVYVGQTRGREWIALMESHGFGEMVVRGEMPPRRKPWAYDNGAFRDWTAKVPFDAEAFMRDVDAIWRYDGNPDFLVLPDIVAAGEKSLDFSLMWVDRLRRLGVPLYLALQDNMVISAITSRRLDSIADGFFIGGTLEWKIRNGAGWVSWAHSIGKPCHVGRVGTEKRVRWARRIGADSIDSCLPLFSEDNLRSFSEDCTPASMSSSSEVQSPPVLATDTGLMRDGEGGGITTERKIPKTIRDLGGVSD
jgi:hypothetical protein